MKKGRHRRFEEARKLKQSGLEPLEPFGDGHTRDQAARSDDDEYAEIAARYGVEFDDEDDEDDDDRAR